MRVSPPARGSSSPAGRGGGDGYSRGVGDERGETLPLFPLSQVVLFPGVRCPLHVFEPRYRQMTEAALAGASRIGMIAVLPGARDAMTGDPPLFEVGCAGTIEEWKRLPDGRYDIVLRGAERFRVIEEIPREGDRLYRVARVEPLEDALSVADLPRVRALRERILGQLGDLLRHSAPESAERYDPARLADHDDATLASLLSQALQLPPAEKQGLLEAADVLDRYERLEAVLAFALASAAGGAPAGKPSLH